MKSDFSSGDKIFAKVKGYPPWPARIEGLADKTPNKQSYHVYFYGTAETAIVKTEDLCSYIYHKSKLGKTIKPKSFLEAIVQIEDELSLEEISILHKLENSQNEKEDSSENKVSDGSKHSSGTGRTTTSSAVKPKAKNKKREFDIFETDKPDILKRRNCNVNEPISASKKEIENESDSKNPEVLATPGRKTEKKIVNFDETEGVLAIVDNNNQALMKDTKNTLDKPTIKDDYIIARMGHKEIKLPILKYRANFDNMQNSFNWTIKVKTYGLFLKKLLEKGKMSPEEAEKFLEMYCNKQSSHSEFAFEILKTETKLLKLNLLIRDALNCNGPDLNRALEILDKMADLNVTPLMLKKHPDVMITIKNLRRFCSPGTSTDVGEVQVKIDLIRLKAEFVLNKFQSLFFIPEDKTFWEVFSLHQERFDLITKNMSEKEFTALIEEPKDAGPLF